MNVNKININQSEPTYYIASNAYNVTYEDSNVGEKLGELNNKVDALALGTFYGFFSNSTSLPTNATTLGYAYVGTDNPYNIWNFNGERWSDSGTSIDMNVDADEEDITRNRDGKLQFKDRASYGNGMGYVILRKDKSFAEQMTKENTIYEIRYDFTLDKNVTIPNNCVLKFEGGSISGNYTITGNNTNVLAEPVNIFKIGITISGTWNITNIYSKWFAFIEGSQNDNISQFRNLFSMMSNIIYNNVYIENGIFYTSAENGQNGFLIPSNTTIYNNANICLRANNLTHYSVFGVYNSENITILGGKLTGDVENHSGTTQWNYGIALKGAKNCTIKNIICEKCYGDGINVNAIPSHDDQPIIHSTNIIIENVICDSNARQGMSIEGCINCIVENSKFINTGQIKVTDPGYGIDLEPWFDGELVQNVTIKNCYLGNNKNGGLMNMLKDSHANVIIENNYIQSLQLSACEYSLVAKNNIIDHLYGYSAKGIILDNNTINNSCKFEGTSSDNILINNIINVTNDYSIFDKCIVKNNIINSKIKCYATGAKFENCIINIETAGDNSVEAQGILEFYNCTIILGKPMYLRAGGGAIIKNSTVERKDTASAIVIFVSDAYKSLPVKLISNTYINASDSSKKVLNWGGANPNYVISDTEIEVATQKPPKPYVGQSYFKNTKPVWYNGTAWVDATGAKV